MRILLSDVDQAAADRLRGEIRAWDSTWQVETATSAERMLAAIAQQQYDAVVWELSTPGSAGLLTVRALREAAAQSALLVTAYPAAETLAAQTTAQGADAYLIRRPDWVDKLCALLGQAQVITRRHQETEGLSRRLRALQAQHEAVLDSVGQPLLVMSPAGRIESCNAAAAGLLGWARERLVGEDLPSLLLTPANLTMLLACLGDSHAVLPPPGPGLISAWREQDQVHAEALVRHEAGHYHLCRLRLRALSPDPDGNLLVALEPVRPDQSGSVAGNWVALEGWWQAEGFYALLVDKPGRIVRVGRGLHTARGRQGPLEGLPAAELLEPQALAQVQAELSLGRDFRGRTDLRIAPERVEPVQLTVVPLAHGEEEFSLWVAVPLEASLSGEPPAVERSLTALAASLQELEGASEPRELPVLTVASADVLLHPDVIVCHLGLSADGGEIGPAESSRGLAATGTGTFVERLTAMLRDGRLPRQTLLLSSLADYCRRCKDNVLMAAFAAEGMISGIWVPICVRDQPVGFVLLAWRAEQSFSTWHPRLLDLWGAAVGRIIAATALHHQTQRTANLAHQLLRISNLLNAPAEVPEVMRKLAEAAGSLTHCACCWVQVLEDQGQQFDRTYRHCPDPQVAQVLNVDVHEAAWRAVRQQEPATSEVEDLNGTGYRLLALPLVVEGRTLGVVVLCFLATQRLGSAVERALQALALEAAVAVHNAQRLEQAAQQAQRWEAEAIQTRAEEARARTVLQAAAAVAEGEDLHDTLVQIARSAATEIGFDRTAVLLADTRQGVLLGRVQARADGTLEDISQEGIPLRPGEDLRADVALGSTPYLIHSVPAEDGGEGGYEQLLLPLRVRGQLVGMIVADNAASHRSISPQQTRLLRALAVLAAVAVEQARMDEARHALISALAHELRRPLASAQAYVELLMEGDAGPLSEQQRAYLQRVEESSLRLAQMIRDLMDWSKLRAGHVAVHPRPCQVGELARQVAEQLQGKARQAQVELVVDTGEAEPVIETDPSLLEQVLSNLVDNAIKFNQSGGKVTVHVWETPEAVGVEVHDTGPGIPGEYHQKIFEEFERGPRELHGRAEGTGLGLATARRLVQSLGGTLGVRSQVGAGSTFSVRLPAPEPPSYPEGTGDSEAQLGVG